MVSFLTLYSNKIEQGGRLVTCLFYGNGTCGHWQREMLGICQFPLDLHGMEGEIKIEEGKKYTKY
jgi:hypothetical protein